MILELKNVCKDYPIGRNASVHALDSVNLSVGEGEFIAIQGMSGSGKTTLLNILGLIDDATAGTYLLDGVDALSLSDSRKSRLRGEKISFVVQDFALIGAETAFFNAALPLLLSRVGQKEIQKRVEEVFQCLGIADQRNKKIRDMSGGQRQRVAIARALVTEPGVILADEPTGALDQKTSEEVMKLLLEANREEKISVVMVTHEPHWAELAARKLWMMDGKLYDHNVYED